MNFLPVILLYLEVLLLAFAEKRLWKTWFTPLNCLSIPYALVLTVCLCIDGKIGFMPFYFPSVWVWIAGLAVFFVPSFVLGVRQNRANINESHTEYPNKFTLPLRTLRILEYVTWGTLTLFGFRFLYLWLGKGLIPGGETFAQDWAGHGFFGHLFTLLMGLSIWWIFAADNKHKRFWLYVLGFFGVALLYLAKCWFLIPMAGGLLLRLLTRKTKFGIKVVLVSVFVGFAFFFATYWMTLYVAAADKGIPDSRIKQPTYKAEVSSFIGKHAVTYLAAGIYGLSEDLAQNTLEYRDASLVYAPFINICKVLGDQDYVSNINDQYVQITTNDSGSNVRTFFGFLYVYLGVGHAIGYALVFSCLAYFLFAFTRKSRHPVLLIVLGWVLACLLMGWFDFYPSSLTFITLPCFFGALYGGCLVWENRHKIPPFKRFYLRWPRRILAILQTVSLALLVSLFWLPLRLPSYFLGVCAGIAFAFVLMLPRRAVDFRFLKPYLFLLAYYMLTWISVSYASNPDFALNNCFRQISIVLIPFIFWGMTPRFFSNQRINLFVSCFVAGCVLLVVAKAIQMVYIFDVLYPFLKLYYIDTGHTYAGSGLLFVINEFLSNQAIYVSWANVRPILHTTIEALILNLAFALVFIARVKQHPFFNSRLKKCLADCAMLLFAAALITSNSKTGQFLFIVNLLLLLVLAFRQKRWKIICSVGTCLVVACTIGLYFFGVGILGRFTNTLHVFEDIKEHKQDKVNDGSLLPRIYCWGTAIEMAKEKPFLGFGAGVKKEYQERFVSRYPNYPIQYKHPHNQFLFIIVSNGIIGLLVFLGVWVQAIRLVWKNRRLWAWIWLLDLFVFCCIDILFISPTLFYTLLPYCFLMVSHYNRQKACGTSRDIRKLAS
ncbi:MAG: DUF6337 family protein [Bacteroides sp.]|nr:DUF6337 family protein [Bacteroides sp.]